MPKLTTLKPRVPALSASRLPTAPAGTPRQRGSTWMRRRAEWLYAHPVCCDCKAEGILNNRDLEVDHEIPLWAGGRDDESNLATRCRTHHQEKTAREAGQRANDAPAGW